MANAEKYLHEHFANAAEGAQPSTPATVPGASGILPDSDAQSLDQPFAKVDGVSANSPAELAGLKIGDEIRNFGYVNRANHDGLKKVAECVQGNEGVCAFGSKLQIAPIFLTSRNRATYLFECHDPPVLPRGRNYG